MENVGFAFAAMVVSAFVALYAGKRAGTSKTYVYVLGLLAMFLQIAVLFAVRDWGGDDATLADATHHAIGLSRLL